MVLRQSSLERLIEEYFKAWVTRDFPNIEYFFTHDVYYRECNGASYRGLNELNGWINSMLKKQTVLEWDISNIEKTDSGVFIVMWFFHAKEEKEYNFDGVSLIDFTDDKISHISEYAASHDLYRPFKETGSN